jgi:hypothetical protein
MVPPFDEEFGLNNALRLGFAKPLILIEIPVGSVCVAPSEAHGSGSNPVELRRRI